MMRLLAIAAVLLVSSTADAASAQAVSGASGAVPTVVVTGANRGLGLAWARKYEERGWNVIATARRPQDASELRTLAQQSARVRIEELDATDPASVDAFGTRLAGVPVDVLIDNAGTIGEEDEQRFGQLDAGKFDHYMRVNALSALLVTERLLPNLRQGRQKKVALNMILRNLAVELGRSHPQAVVAGLHPGTVDTGLSAPFQKGVKPEKLFTAAYSAERLLAVVDGLTPADSGGVFAWDGARIPE